jgi:hypothetical protein
MPVLSSRLFKPIPKELPWRVNVILVVSGVAGIIIIEALLANEPVSLRTLAIAAGIVTGIGCLIYAPASIFKTLAYAIIIGAFFYFADRVKEWEVVGFIVLCAAIWIVHRIGQAEALLVKRMDELETKIDEQQDKS